MNPRAKLMGVPGYVKRSSKNVRSAENNGRHNWKRDQDVDRYLSR